MATYFRSFLNGLKGMRGTTVPLQLREVFCDKRISSNTNNAYVTKKKHFIWVSMYLARKYHLGTLYCTPPNGDGTAILRGHPSHAKVQPLSGQREYLHFSVILRPWVLVRPRESNPRPPALPSSALLTELILPRFFVNSGSFFHCAWCYTERFQML